MKRKKTKIIGLSMLFLSICLVLYNCKKQEVLYQESYFKTVSIQESLRFLQSEVNLKNKSANTLSLDIDFDKATHEDLIDSNEKITVIPATTQYKNIYSRVVLMRINDNIKSVIINMMPSDSTKLFTGRIGITNLEREFIIGYRVNNGTLISKLVKSNKTTTMHRKGQGELCDYHADGDPNCMFTDTVLDEVVITVQSNDQGLDPFDEGGSDYDVDYSQLDWNFGDGNPNGGNNNNSDTCPGIKVLNPVTSICECPSGYDEDASGKCVKTPCVGDPVPNPEIVSSGKSGKKGGTFGCTRTDSAESCGGVKGKKMHDGLDIKATINTNTYSMYNGTVSKIRNSFTPGQYKQDSYGNYILVTTKINGKTVFIKYNHLNKVNVKNGDKIKAGDIIGLNGNTGNANPPNGKVTPHIHLQVYDTNWKSIDPKAYLNTKFDSNQNPIPNTNC